MARNVRNKLFGTGDPQLDMAVGMVPGVRTRNAFAINTDIDAGVAETLWNVGGDWVGPTTPQTLTLVSDSADDDAVTGQGAWEVTVVGLSSLGPGGILISEKVLLDGITPVQTQNDYAISCFVHVTNHGTTGINAGSITVTATDDATAQHRIDPNVGTSQTAVCAVLTGQTMVITGYHGAIRSKTGGNVDFELLTDRGDHLDLTADSFTRLHSQTALSSGTSAFVQRFNPYIAIGGPAAIQIRVTADSNNMEVVGGFDLVVVDNVEMNRLRKARKLPNT